MARCMRYSLPAVSKYVFGSNSLRLTQSPLKFITQIQNLGMRQSSSALFGPFLRKKSATLTAVKSSTCDYPRALQTEVDKELTKFLEKEITFEESERKKQVQVKGVDGFEVTTADADITLTRKSGNEIIKVKFTVNGSVDAEASMQADDQEAEPEMVSRPPFTVEITKGDGRTLSLHCTFVSPAELEQETSQDTEAIVDNFEIQEVALHTGELTETVYSVSADIMDGNLYDLLMDMLDERGINDEFANQLVDFSSSYEHSKYVEFLKNLKSFAEK
ncbi:hypothetical protein C0Q70_08483 [Pomacea canaliculata]|uniref:Complement component 1 Q subcomponent-binding protein, mitochondrial n=2 Tax=Pomacea canaliculata TaxID=400727 RepID=A0A2T7PHY6_POMCA|nr:hypothetical protein C0Q70_08483 [Pomacea canaliculata]